MWWMRVAASFRFGLTFHDRKVRHALGGALEFSSQLIAFEVNQAHLLDGHEPFGHESRGAEHEVVTHTNGEVTAIAIGVFTSPHALANLDHALFEFHNRRRVEKGVNFFGSFRIFSWCPMEFVIRQNRLDFGHCWQVGCRRCDERFGNTTENILSRGGHDDSFGNGGVATADHGFGVGCGDDFFHFC